MAIEWQSVAIEWPSVAVSGNRWQSVAIRIRHLHERYDAARLGDRDRVAHVTVREARERSRSVRLALRGRRTELATIAEERHERREAARSCDCVLVDG